MFHPKSQLLRSGEVVPMPASSPDESREHGYKRVGTRDCTLREFLTYKTNPRQRDTQARVQKAKHLNVYEPDHSLIKVAIYRGQPDSGFRDGDTVLITAHTRQAKWGAGDVKGLPDNLVIHEDVYEAYSKDALCHLYSLNDSHAAVRSVRDQVHELARMHKIAWQSPGNNTVLMKATAIKEVFGEIRRGRGIGSGFSTKEEKFDVAVDLLMPAIIKLNAAIPDLRPNKFVGSTTFAALTSTLAYPEKAPTYWDLYNGGHSAKDADGSYDAVFYAEETFRKTRTNKGSQAIVKDGKIYLRGFMLWLEDDDARRITRTNHLSDRDYDKLIDRAATRLNLPERE